jgi:hypothetical protein
MSAILARGSAAVILVMLTAAVALGQVEGGFPGFLPATTVQLPTFGISIDADGTLDAKTFKDVDGKLLRVGGSRMTSCARSPG